MNGLEPIPPLIVGSSTGPLRSSKGQLGANGYRSYGSHQSMDSVWDEFANKSLPPEETELMIKRLEKRADERIQRSYAEGQFLDQVVEGAVVLRVGIVFMPGANKPEVTRQEQIDMSGQEPDQKDGLWRVNTAGLLLSVLEVSKDL